MESGEHMPDKPRFMKELFRVTAPGGRILIVTWCHRELMDGEASLSQAELSLLEKINKGLYEQNITFDVYFNIVMASHNNFLSFFLFPFVCV